MKLKNLLLILTTILTAAFITACTAEPETIIQEVEKIVEVTSVVEVVKEVEKEVEKLVEVEVTTEVEVEVVKEVEVAGGARGIGGRVTILYWQAASNLNPYQSGGTKEIDAASIVIEPLARYDENGQLVPFLAAEIPTVENGGVSEDLTTITWKLKEGVFVV